VSDGRVLLDRDEQTGIARLTINNPDRRNSYDPAMREQLGRYLDDLALDDDIKVVVLRGEGGVFSTGADMDNAYAWYGSKDAAEENGERRPRRPSQRRRLSVDRKTFAFYHDFLGYPKATVAEVRGFGPNLARRLLLTGDTIRAAELEHRDVFTEVVDDSTVGDRAMYWARKVAKMPADGIVMAKEAFRLVEQMQGYQGEEVLSYMVHAYGTNLQFEPDEFNFVKTRAQHGTKRAFELRDEHFEVPEP
jgi:enoyl-CoA hydratase